jgi:hypothetical protein
MLPDRPMLRTGSGPVVQADLLMGVAGGGAGARPRGRGPGSGPRHRRHSRPDSPPPDSRLPPRRRSSASAPGPRPAPGTPASQNSYELQGEEQLAVRLRQVVQPPGRLKGLQPARGILDLPWGLYQHDEFFPPRDLRVALHRHDEGGVFPKGLAEGREGRRQEGCEKGVAGEKRFDRGGPPKVRTAGMVGAPLRGTTLAVPSAALSWPICRRRSALLEQTAPAVVRAAWAAGARADVRGGPQAAWHAVGAGEEFLLRRVAPHSVCQSAQPAADRSV